MNGSVDLLSFTCWYLAVDGNLSEEAYFQYLDVAVLTFNARLLSSLPICTQALTSQSFSERPPPGIQKLSFLFSLVHTITICAFQPLIFGFLNIRQPHSIDDYHQPQVEKIDRFVLALSFKLKLAMKFEVFEVDLMLRRFLFSALKA